MSNTQVKVTMNPGWDKKIANNLKKGLLELTTDVQTRSIVLAPRLTGALASSAIIGTVIGGYKVTYGSSRVPYARIHELGGKTGRNYSVNIDAKHYLSKAGESVARGNIAKYFRGKV